MNKYSILAYSGDAGVTGLDTIRLRVACSDQGSSICGICISQLSTLLDAQQHRSRASSSCKLRQRRAGTEFKIKEPLHSECITWRNGPNHTETASVLARLFSVLCTSTLRCSWLRAVSAHLYSDLQISRAWSMMNVLKGWFRYYCLSIMDKHHHPDINFEQGMKILAMCVDELKRRLPIDFKGVSPLFNLQSSM